MNHIGATLSGGKVSRVRVRCVCGLLLPTSFTWPALSPSVGDYWSKAVGPDGGWRIKLSHTGSSRCQANPVLRGDTLNRAVAGEIDAGRIRLVREATRESVASAVNIGNVYSKEIGRLRARRVGQVTVDLAALGR